MLSDLVALRFSSMKFKLLKPRRHRRRPKRGPLAPRTFAALSELALALARRRSRQTSRRQTFLRRACAREITAPKPP